MSGCSGQRSSTNFRPRVIPATSGSPWEVAISGSASTDGHCRSGGQRLSLWIYASDCDAAIERLRSAGAEIVDEPATQPWGEQMARVLDPGGNEIVIGQQAL